MTYDEFLERVGERSGADRDAARAATAMALEALAKALTPDEAHDLAAQLPSELKNQLRTEHQPARMSAGDFVQQLADRTGHDHDAARAEARAVLLTLQDAVTDAEISDVFAQLPDDFRGLLAPA